MLGFFVFLLILAAIQTLLIPKLPTKLSVNLNGLIFLALGIYLVYQLYKLKIAYTIAAAGIYFFSYELFDTFRVKKLEKEMILLCFFYSAVLLFLNRGIRSRVIDSAHAVNYWEQYNLNYQLRYANNKGLFREKKDYKMLVVTLDDNASEEERSKFISKAKKRANFGDYMIIILNYDGKKLVSTGYSYQMDKKYESDRYYVTDYVVDWVEKGRTNTSLCRYVDKMNKKEEEYWENASRNNQGAGSSGGSDEYDPEQWDEDGDGEFPGAHWVEGYDRSDGTHVDGYYRTNPDDDVTNNFSYSGPDANNNSEEYDYYYNYDEYSDPGYDGGGDY